MSASDGGDADVNKLFESSDEEEAQQPAQQAPAEEKSATQAALDALQDSDDDFEAAPLREADGSAAPASQEPASANRRFAAMDEDELEDAEADAAITQEPQEPEPEPGPPLELEGPLADGLDSSQIRLVRPSNVLSIESRPFSADTYEYEEEEYEDPETGQLRVKLNSAIRWRYAQQPDGSTVRESNARFVRWSDGSLQLLLGDEVLDVAERDIGSDNHFLFVRHRGFIQGQAQLPARLSFRPSSIHSRTHKLLTAAMDRRHGLKTSRVQATTTVFDPSKVKAEQAKQEEARIRDREGLAKRQEKEMRKYARPAPQCAGGLSAAYLEAADEEQEEEDDGYDADIRRPRRDADAEAEAELRLTSAKRAAPPRSAPLAKRPRAAYDLDEEEDEGMQDFIVNDVEEDDEEAVGASRKPAGRRRIALSDEDDD